MRPLPRPRRRAPAPQATAAALVVRSAVLDCEGISLALGLAPTEAVAADPASAHGFRRSATWSISSAGMLSSDDPGDHLDWLLDRVQPVAERLSALVARRDAGASISCRYPARDFSGPTLDPARLRAIADLGLGLDLMGVPVG